MKRRTKRKYPVGGYIAESDNTKSVPVKYGSKTPISTPLIEYVQKTNGNTGGRNAVKGTIESTSNEWYDPINLITGEIASRANSTVKAFNKSISKVKPEYGNKILKDKNAIEDAIYDMSPEAKGWGEFSNITNDYHASNEFLNKALNNLGGTSDNIKLTPQWNKMYMEPNAMLKGEPGYTRQAVNQSERLLKNTDKTPKARFKLQPNGSLKNVGAEMDASLTEPIKAIEFRDNIMNTMNRKGGKLKRKHNPIYHPGGDVQSTYNANSAGNTTFEFGFGGQTGRTPEGDIISSIGQGAYLGQMGRKMRRGGRMYDEGGLKSSSGNFDFGNSNATQYTAPSTQTYEMSPQQTTSGSALPQQQTLNQPSSNYGSYINAGMSVGQGLQNWGNTNNNPNLTKDQKNNANTYSAVDTTVNTVGAFVPAVGIIKGAADMGKGVVDSTNPNTTTVDPSTGKSYTYKGGANGDNAAAWKASYDPVGNVTNGIGSFTGSTENYGNDNIGMGVLDFAAPFISAGLRNKGAREAGEAAKYNIPNKGNIIQNSVNNNYDNSYLAGSKGIANGQVARLGGRVRRMANGGPVQQKIINAPELGGYFIEV